MKRGRGDILDLDSLYLQMVSDAFKFKILGIILVFVGAFIVLRLGSAALTRIFDRAVGSDLGDAQKMRTVSALIKSIMRYCVYFLSIVLILNILGIKTGALLASAGVVGLAIGFGAKSLVEDLLSGVFLIIEGQFAVGDSITAMDVTGVVESIGMRITKLRDADGALHYLPNGKIVLVTNHSRSGK